MLARVLLHVVMSSVEINNLYHLIANTQLAFICIFDPVNSFWAFPNYVDNFQLLFALALDSDSAMICRLATSFGKQNGVLMNKVILEFA